MEKQKEQEFLVRLNKATDSKARLKLWNIMSQEDVSNQLWLQAFLTSVEAFEYYLQEVGYPSIELLTKMWDSEELLNLYGKSFIFRSMEKRLYKNPETIQEFEDLITANVKIFGDFMMNGDFEYAESLIQERLEEFLNKFEEARLIPELSRMLEPELLSNKNAADIITGFANDDLKRLMFKKLIIADAQKGEFDMMTSHIASAKECTNISLEDLTSSMEKQTKSRVLDAETSNLKIAIDIIKENN